MRIDPFAQLQLAVAVAQTSLAHMQVGVAITCSQLQWRNVKFPLLQLQLRSRGYSCDLGE